MRLPAPALALAIISCAAGSSAKSPALRGVNPSLSHLYTRNSTHFHCLHGEAVIPLSAINDDYCDCPDGSDEPGTSACEGRPEAPGFWCRNEGHIPGVVIAGRVNDGLCEEECCDGSDEWATGACPNRCDEMGKAYRTRVAAEAQTRKTGAKIRGTYIKHARNERTRLEEEIARKRSEVSEKEVEAERLRVALEGVEAKSQVELEKRKQTSLFQTLLSQRNLLTRLRAQTSDLQKELDELHAILDDLRRGYNPNYQDMAVKAAVVGYEELTGISKSTEEAETSSGEGGVEEAVEPAEAQTPVDAAPKVEKVPEWELDQAERKDLEGLLLEDMETRGNEQDDEASTGLLYKIDEYIPDFLFEPFDTLREALADFLLKWGIFGKVAKIATGSNDAPHTAAARQRHTDASNDLHRLQREISTTQDTLTKLQGAEYGLEGEWKKLDGTCVEKISGDYTYELCFFGSATQKSNKDYSNNHLGAFSHWNSAAEAGSFEYYAEQGYRNGAKCWNGPNRSVDVVLSCGTKNELLAVSEPEKCEYRFKVTSPAMCWPAGETGEGGTVVLADKGKAEL